MVSAGKAAPIPTTNTGGTGSAARSRREMVGELALRLLAVGVPGARGDKENTFGGFLAWSAQPSETLRLLAIVATSGILLADTGPSATSRPYIWNTDIRLAIKQADLIASEGDDGQRELLAAIMGQMLTQTSQSVIARLASAFSHDQVKASLMSWQSQGGLAKTMAQPAPEKEHFDLMQPDSRLVHLIATMGRWARADESKAFQVALPQDGALWNSDGAPKPEQAVFLAMMRELAMQQTLGSAPRANRPRM